MSTAAAEHPLAPPVADWLRRHLGQMMDAVELGIFCAGQGLRLHQIASPLLSLDTTVELLVEHLRHTGTLLSFAAEMRRDDGIGGRARDLGLGALLGDSGLHQQVRPPLYCHRLLRAATFAGRTQELSTLDWAWQEGARVLGLTGPPGCGKTALLQHWLDGRGLSDPRRWKDFGVEGLFVWSFFSDPDVSSFLRAAADYVASGLPVGPAGRDPGTGAVGNARQRVAEDGLGEEEVRRADLSRLLRALDRCGGHVILVLDGLERFQAGVPPWDVALSMARTPSRPDLQLSRFDAPRPGEITEPALRTLLLELAAVDGEAALLCTLEREVPSLRPWRGSGYVVAPVPPLPSADGVRLLRQTGATRGGDGDAEQRCLEHRGHVLTLDLLGRYLGAYYRGDARAVTVGELPPSDDAGRLAEAPTLGRVLRAQTQALTDQLRGLLELCVLLPGQTTLSALLSLSQVAREHPPQGGPLAVETVLSPLRGLDAAALRARLFDLGRLGLLQLHVTPGPQGEETVAVDLHPLLRRLLYRSWLLFRGGRAVVPAGAPEGTDILPRAQDTAVLDLLEQLVLAALEAGLLGEAYELLTVRMGGYAHLGRGLGEYRRLLGVLRILSPVLATVSAGDPLWARRCARVITWEAETLRDLGMLEEALAITQTGPSQIAVTPHGARFWEVEVHLLSGRLREGAEAVGRCLSAAQSVASRVLAALLQARTLLLLGETAQSKIYLLDAELTLREQPSASCEWDGLSLRELLDRERVQVALRLSDVVLARHLLGRCQAAAMRDGRGKDQAYLDILHGETARRERDQLDAAQAVHRALFWGSRTGDADVLVRAGLCHARIRMDAGNLDGAASAVGIALPTAVELGLHLWRIDLLLMRGHLTLRRGDIAAAESDARDALAYATAPGCGYVWGEADALHLLALALLAGRPPGARVLEAVTHLSDEIDLRDRMMDGRADDVRWLLGRLTA